ncbi:MAG: UDP-N-acetylmuramate dehydrogenase [Bacteroidales bacterium]|nr:UDP-N-acetylmuramate dehydrogenase [Bacteroidales bacterium]
MILRNISLKPYNTFGLDYKANCLAELSSEEEAVDFLRDKKLCREPLLIIGEGSNILFTGDYKGTIIYAKIEGIKVDEQNDQHIIVSAGSGVKWNHFVEWCVNNGYGGVENLSLIPGLVGATPVQNIGAYGMEVKDTIEKVRTINISNGSVREFSNEECRFGYRDSIFKKDLKSKYLVIKVFFKLNTIPSFKIEYGSLKKEVEKLGEINLRNVRQAVINIRRCKLPDTEVFGNAGSFFKNPVVNKTEAENLFLKYPYIPHYFSFPGGIKLAAGWLIEQCGWKEKRIGGAGVYDKQALVLINHGNATGKDIYDLSEAIKQSVLRKFGLELEREVEIIGPI